MYALQVRKEKSPNPREVWLEQRETTISLKIDDMQVAYFNLNNSYFYIFNRDLKEIGLDVKATYDIKGKES